MSENKNIPKVSKFFNNNSEKTSGKKKKISKKNARLLALRELEDNKWKNKSKLYQYFQAYCDGCWTPSEFKYLWKRLTARLKSEGRLDETNLVTELHDQLLNEYDYYTGFTEEIARCGGLVEERDRRDTNEKLQKETENEKQKEAENLLLKEMITDELLGKIPKLFEKEQYNSTRKDSLRYVPNVKPGWTTDDYIKEITKNKIPGVSKWELQMALVVDEKDLKSPPPLDVGGLLLCLETAKVISFGDSHWFEKIHTPYVTTYNWWDSEEGQMYREKTTEMFQKEWLGLDKGALVTVLKMDLRAYKCTHIEKILSMLELTRQDDDDKTGAEMGVGRSAQSWAEAWWTLPYTMKLLALKWKKTESEEKAVEFADLCVRLLNLKIKQLVKKYQ